MKSLLLSLGVLLTSSLARAAAEQIIFQSTFDNNELRPNLAVHYIPQEEAMRKDTKTGLDFELKNFFQLNAPEDRVSRWHRKLHVASNLEVSAGLNITFKAALKGKGAAKVSVMESEQWTNETNAKIAIRLVKNDTSSAFEVDYLDIQNVKWRAIVLLNHDISAPSRYSLQLNPANATSHGSLSLKLNKSIIVEETPLESLFEKLTD